jgi:glycosyltransferase involved in cell wall biosynthesis
MHIFLNALGANTASGLTYLRNVLPQLEQRGDTRTTVAANSFVQAEFKCLRNVAFLDIPGLRSTARRFWFEQMRLPTLIRQVDAEVLISAGNIAVRNSPVPQILLSGNSLYTSDDFYRDLLSRHEYGMWLDTRIRAFVARKSVSWADCTVAPTQAFARELQRWTGQKVSSIHHGFDCDIFFSDKTRLPSETRAKLDATKNDLKLLYVTHYNYFRNFETLFRALPLIREKLSGRNVRLFLTCKLQDGENPGSYKTKAARDLLRQLGIEREVIELGAIPYRQLHQVYRACNVYVTSSYAETFAHPLVEAQASGLRIVASDLPVHREVAGDSALYFSRFSPQEIALCVLQAADAGSFTQLSRPASTVKFSWGSHVDQLFALAGQISPRRLAA